MVNIIIKIAVDKKTLSLTFKDTFPHLAQKHIHTALDMVNFVVPHGLGVMIQAFIRNVMELKSAWKQIHCVVLNCWNAPINIAEVSYI